MRVRFQRTAAAAAALLLASGTTALPARADSPFERVGVGTAFAMPTPGVSLFGQLDERWSGTLLIGLGVDARANYARGESLDRYWTVGAGYVVEVGVVRAGYGRTWQRGPWRWHLEATLNLPVYVDVDDDGGGLVDVAVAAYTLLVPIGFGVHYVFGDR